MGRPGSRSMRQCIGRAGVVAVLALVSLALVAPSTALAAFPGANGKIAFSSTQHDPNPSFCAESTCNWEIYTINPDGTGKTRLTNSPLQDQDPNWSHDGSKIVFHRKDGSTNTHEIYVMNANGSGQTLLGPGRTPSWSPDGQKIAFSDCPDNCSLWVMNADGSDRTEIFDLMSQYPDDYFDHLAPQWSPLGDRIMFESWTYYAASNAALGFVDPDGSDFQQSSGPDGYDRRPEWSPSANDIAFSREDPNAETGPDLWTGVRGFLRPYADNPAWSPDGRKIAYTEGSGIHIIELGSGLLSQVTSDLGPECCLDWQPLRALALYPRPSGGSPLNVPLVPAYKRCDSPNSQHVTPLAQPSCTPPALQSTLLTTSTIGLQVGLMRFDVHAGNPMTPADEADVNISLLLSDVRRASDQADYSGELIARTRMRITDRASGFGGVSATTADFNFDATVPCTASAPTNRGSDCPLSTSADALVPGAIVERRRSVIAMPSVSVMDAGADGNVTTASCPPTCGTGDEQAYVKSGVFAP